MSTKVGYLVVCITLDEQWTSYWASIRNARHHADWHRKQGTLLGTFKVTSDANSTTIEPDDLAPVKHHKEAP